MDTPGRIVRHLASIGAVLGGGVLRHLGVWRGGLRLHAVEESGGALGIRGGGEDRAPVILQNSQ